MPITSPPTISEAISKKNLAVEKAIESIHAGAYGEAVAHLIEAQAWDGYRTGAIWGKTEEE